MIRRLLSALLLLGAVTAARADDFSATAVSLSTANLTGVVPIAKGGTASGTALSGSTIMDSNGTAIVQGPAGTSTTLLHGNASGQPTYSAVSLSADVTGTLSGSSVSGGTFGAVNGSALTSLTPANLTASGTFPAENGSALTSLTPANISNGALPVGVTITTNNVTASGTPSATTFYRGDASWATAGVSYPLTAPNGTSAAPSYSFSNATNAGMNWDGTNLNFVVAGSTQVRVSANGLLIPNVTGLNFTGNGTIFNLGAGSAGSPAVANSNFGMYFAGGSETDLAANGVQDLRCLGNAGCTMKGTNTNDNATALWVGEYASTTSTTFANLATTGQFGNVVSMSLTAGDWDVTGRVTVSLNGAAMTDYEIAVSTFSANTTTDHTEGLNWIESSAFPIATANSSAVAPEIRMTMAGTTTVYLKVKGAYSVATPQALGSLTARRRR